MREIKFRAWFKDDERIYYQVKNTASSMYGLERFCQLVGSAKGYTFEIMQFTGLKDKNGKDLYEGDIVKNNDYVWSIYWSDEYSDACYRMALDGNKSNNDLLFINESQHSEIIGNIYENPELLK